MKKVAMQYSPMCAIPYVSMVDGGTIELVRSLGVDVVSSAELIQTFEARWTPEARDMHFEAGRRVDRVRNDAFALIRERLANGQMLTEFEVKTFFRDRFAAEGLVTDHGPIVGVNANASNPHYEPMELSLIHISFAFSRSSTSRSTSASIAPRRSRAGPIRYARMSDG